MRFLGFLFLLVLLVAGVGYCRGWFSVSTSHASGREEITLGVDEDRIGSDTKAAADKLGRLSKQAVEKVKAIWREVGPDRKEVEGKVAAIDTGERRLAIDADERRIDLHVPVGTAIERDGAAVDFAQLQPGAHIKLVLHDADTGDGEDWRLQRIELLP